MSFYLEKPSLKHKDRYLDYIKEWKDTKIVPYSSRIIDKTYEEWLLEKSLQESVETAPKDFVPASTFLFMDDEVIVGCVNIRHKLNQKLLETGGHIGYGIRPSKRNLGYAGIMLKLALIESKSLGIKRALITCDDDNLASKGTIESCGGIYENKFFDKDHYVLRYWIIN
ncbi:MAG: GNAT family N-acetyltransferase [Candidatus Izemoplasmatales bacterium]|nr:GNAT family N-acetyltransferase [Candidatus Izemoplasmatales bacterium]